MLTLFRTEVAPLSQGITGSVQHSVATMREAYRLFQYALLLGTVRLLPRL